MMFSSTLIALILFAGKVTAVPTETKEQPAVLAAKVEVPASAGMIDAIRDIVAQPMKDADPVATETEKSAETKLAQIRGIFEIEEHPGDSNTTELAQISPSEKWAGTFYGSGCNCKYIKVWDCNYCAGCGCKNVGPCKNTRSCSSFNNKYCSVSKHTYTTGTQCTGY